MREPASLEALPGREGSGRIHTPPGHGLIQSSQSASRIKNVPIGPATDTTGEGDPARGPRPQSGYIGLQNHDHNSVVFFKEVSVRSLPSGGQ